MTQPLEPAKYTQADGANNQANFALRFRFQFNTVNTDWGRPFT